MYSWRSRHRDAFHHHTRITHIPAAASPSDLPPASAALAATACTAWSRGWCGTLAGILEATAPKPGNVHPGASFADLTYDDLLAAAVAIGPAIDRAAERPLGSTIRAAVEAARPAAGTNANLGIVLLTAPLAAVPDGTPLCAAAVEDVLTSLGPADAADIWRAIAIARPGGMGSAEKWDVAGPPPDDIRAAMRLAADRDWIARLWAFGFEPLFAGPVRDLLADLEAGEPLLEAIVRCHVRHLARVPDSLISRRHGAAVAADVSARAVDVLATPPDRWPAALAEFDTSLRTPRRLNPGTTADTIAATLYILLRDGRLRPFLPFATPLFPGSAPLS
ncbi:MAG: triphosphoribosyl-dephospho-CoA synthase [Planctomycetia bacterium]|nr:triphosphoribosyl-dephospho-CoA synthase [Planctomycetia bacterium]